MIKPFKKGDMLKGGMIHNILGMLLILNVTILGLEDKSILIFAGTLSNVQWTNLLRWLTEKDW